MLDEKEEESYVNSVTLPTSSKAQGDLMLRRYRHCDRAAAPSEPVPKHSWLHEAWQASVREKAHLLYAVSSTLGSASAPAAALTIIGVQAYRLIGIV